MSGGGEEEATHEGLLYWDFKGAMFFSFTIVTTIGFGSYAPTYPESRLFLMLYVVVGFACTGVVAQVTMRRRKTKEGEGAHLPII